LPSNNRRDKHTNTQTDWEGFMKKAVEMGSGAISSFIKTGLGIEKLIGRIYRHREHGDLKSLLLFFQNKEIRLKM
jgi:hypothetical protein